MSERCCYDIIIRGDRGCVGVVSSLCEIFHRVLCHVCCDPQVLRFVEAADSDEQPSKGLAFQLCLQIDDDFEKVSCGGLIDLQKVENEILVVEDPLKNFGVPFIGRLGGEQYFSQLLSIPIRNLLRSVIDHHLLRLHLGQHHSGLCCLSL